MGSFDSNLLILREISVKLVTDDETHRLYAFLWVYGCILCLYKQVSGKQKLMNENQKNKMG